jgi:hypothetical protein
MSLPVLLLLLAVQTVPAEEEIVIIAKRFSGIQVTVGKDARGRFTCSLNASSGNVGLDKRLCATAAGCVAKGARTQETARACIEQRKPQLFADFRREWLGGAR